MSKEGANKYLSIPSKKVFVHSNLSKKKKKEYLPIKYSNKKYCPLNNHIPLSSSTLSTMLAFHHIDAIPICTAHEKRILRHVLRLKFISR